MDFIIRKANEKDYPGLAKLYDEMNELHSKALPDIFFTPPATPQNLIYVQSILRNKDAVLFIAEKDTEVIGLVHASIKRSPDTPVHIKRKYVYIEDICVKGEYRRSGVGRELMASTEKWAFEKGISDIELNVWDFNEKAISFYKSIGFGFMTHIMREKTG